MTAIDDWFDSGNTADIAGRALKPRQNPLMATPLVVIQGQASSYRLDEANNVPWILKCFLPASRPQRDYVDAIASCVPRIPECRCGWERQVLTRGDLGQSKGMYYSDNLAELLDGNLLFPRLPGVSWGDLLWDMANDKVVLTHKERLMIGHRLAKVLSLLEQSGCSHRDLSAGNILVDQQAGDIYLIDWDTLYHPDLTYQSNTKIGSPGYIVPWVEHSPTESWCPHADRFALAVCITELLVVTPGTTLHGDGSLFEQSHLGQDVAALKQATDTLQMTHAPTVPLFQAAWFATSFDQCPTPGDWVRVLSSGIELTLDETLVLLDDAIVRGDDENIVHLARECRKLGGVPLQPSVRSRVLLARCRMEALQYLREALRADDDGLIAHRYDIALLDPCQNVTTAERERVALAVDRVG